MERLAMTYDDPHTVYVALVMHAPNRDRRTCNPTLHECVETYISGALPHILA